MTFSQKMTVRKTKTIKRSVFMKAKIGGSWCGAPYIRYEYELLCDTDSYTVEVVLSEWLNAATLRVVGDTILPITALLGMKTPARNASQDNF